MDKKAVRKLFREAVFKRDGNKCRVCGKTNVDLDAHHITDRHIMPNGGYVPENGISLCSGDDGCHLKAEKWHLSQELQWIPGFHPDELYRLIGSSFLKAWDASQNLDS